MRFSEPLAGGLFLRRYKRFLVDVELDGDGIVTAHCPNTGSLHGCLGRGWPVRLSRSANPRRKLPFTWEMIHNGTCWIGVNTLNANRVAAEGVRSGAIPELGDYEALRREVTSGATSRIDMLLTRGEERCFVEVKNVTMINDAGMYAFPDAPAARGRKHLGELERLTAAGHRAVMLYIIQRSDGTGFTIDAGIDPAYAAALERATAGGVEVLAYRAEVSPQSIVIAARVPFKP